MVRVVEVTIDGTIVLAGVDSSGHGSDGKGLIAGAERDE